MTSFALEQNDSLDVNKAMDDGATPLYIASQEGHWEVVRQLLEHSDIDVNTTMQNGYGENGQGETPLGVAQRKEHQAIIELLSGEVTTMCGFKM
eukprot:939271-Pyramimonas_sp.AAC.1